MALLPILAGFGVLLSVLVGAVTLTNLSIARQASSAESAQRRHGAIINVLSRATHLLSEGQGRYTAPMTGENLSAMGATLTEEGLRVHVSDESEKINVNLMAYVLPAMLQRMAGMDAYYVTFLMEELARQQGMVMGQNSKGVGYPWRPPGSLTMAVEPHDPSYPFPNPAQPPYTFEPRENRHMFLARSKGLPSWRGLEEPDDLRLIWFQFMDPAGANYDPLFTSAERILPGLTTFPTLGVNLNTAPANRALDSVITWHKDASLVDPRYTRLIDTMVMDQAVEYPYLHFTKRLFQNIPSQGVNAASFLWPRAKAQVLQVGKDVENGRSAQPYTSRDLLQALGVHSFLFPMRYVWDHFGSGGVGLNGAPPTEAAHFKIMGPGPFTAHSSGYYAVHFEGGGATVDTVMMLGEEGVKIVKWRQNE